MGVDPPPIGTNPAGLEGTESESTRELGLLWQTNKSTQSLSTPRARGVCVASTEQTKFAGDLADLRCCVSSGSSAERKGSERMPVVWEAARLQEDRALFWEEGCSMGQRRG